MFLLAPPFCTVHQRKLIERNGKEQCYMSRIADIGKVEYLIALFHSTWYASRWESEMYRRFFFVFLTFLATFTFTRKSFLFLLSFPFQYPHEHCLFDCDAQCPLDFNQYPCASMSSQQSDGGKERRWENQSDCMLINYCVIVYWYLLSRARSDTAIRRWFVSAVKEAHVAADTNYDWICRLAD